MLRGFTKFRCPNCGHIFEAPDIEDNATVRSTPMPCPCCGTKSNPLGACVDPASNIIGWIQSTIGRKGK